MRRGQRERLPKQVPLTLKTPQNPPKKDPKTHFLPKNYPKNAQQLRTKNQGRGVRFIAEILRSRTSLQHTALLHGARVLQLDLIHHVEIRARAQFFTQFLRHFWRSSGTQNGSCTVFYPIFKALLEVFWYSKWVMQHIVGKPQISSFQRYKVYTNRSSIGKVMAPRSWVI